ncbi:Tetraspanin-5 [Trichinella nelsoni]|uniref:Tetraspanin-33 n=1 Tax=Trichinella nelsoni TaxID=6336 RepID=A0A0V0SN92_9BILA|nr:Tetraspanin-5 [Trichinella nelsoni]
MNRAPRIKSSEINCENGGLKLVLRFPKGQAPGSSQDNFSSEDEDFEKKAEDEEKPVQAASAEVSVKRRRKRKRFLFTNPARTAKRRARSELLLSKDHETDAVSDADSTRGWGDNGASKQLPTDQMLTSGQDEQATTTSEQNATNNNLQIIVLTPFQRLLMFCLQYIISKDKDEFFSKPSEKIAKDEGSTVVDGDGNDELVELNIFNPVREKILSNHYKSLSEMKTDLLFMKTKWLRRNVCSIRERLAAKKLTSVIEYTFSKERVDRLRRTLPFMKFITEAELGFVEKRHFMIRRRLAQRSRFIIEEDEEKSLRSESASDDEAAHSGAESEVSVHPTFDVNNAPSSSCLNFITPELLTSPESGLNENRNVIQLRQLLPPLLQGSPGLFIPKSDHEDFVPVTPLYYGAFQSFAPVYDSTYATATVDESKFFYQNYHKMIIPNVFDHAPTDNFEIDLAAGILDVTSNGAFRQTLKTVFKTAVDDAEKSEPTTDLLNIDFEYLKTLKDDSGINMDFLDDIQKHCFSRAVKSNDAILEENEMLIVQLVQKQLLRLNQSPHMTLSMADGPGDDEAQTAQKFIKNLKNLILEVTPSALLGNDIRLVESMCSTNVAEEQNESQMSENNKPAVELLRETIQFFYLGIPSIGCCRCCKILFFSFSSSIYDNHLSSKFFLYDSLILTGAHLYGNASRALEFDQIFLIASIALIVIGCWALTTKELEGTKMISSAWDFVFDATIIFIIVGLIAFFLASAGCIGALRENVTYLKCFWMFLLAIVSTLLILSIVGFAMWPHFLHLAKEKLSAKLIQRYFDDPDLQDIIDFMQTKFKCCGLSDKGFHDWSKNMYFNCTPSNADPRRCGVPYSCCLPQTRVIDGFLENYYCGFGIQHLTHPEAALKIYTGGCVDEVLSAIRENIITFCSISLGISLIPLLNICLAVTLIAYIEEDSMTWYDARSAMSMYPLDVTEGYFIR